MPKDPLDEDTRFRLLRALAQDPQISQRELSQRLGVSLGKVNYCLHALINKGWVKAENFRRSSRKYRYLYKLTPSGVTEKARITQRFLQRKLSEHAALTAEIEALRDEAAESPPLDP